MNTAIHAQALALSSEERASLALALLGSLEAEPSQSDDVSQEWLAAAAQRAQEIDSGQAELIPYDVIRKQAQALCR